MKEEKWEWDKQEKYYIFSNSGQTFLPEILIFFVFTMYLKGKKLELKQCFIMLTDVIDPIKQPTTISLLNELNIKLISS